MSTQSSNRFYGNRVLVFLLAGVLVSSCVTIKQPPRGANTRNPVVARVDVGRVCGRPFQAFLNGSDVTSQFFPSSPSSTESQATFPSLPGGSNTLTANAEVERGVFFPYCADASDTTTFNVDVDTPYMAKCRARGVPIPPDWAGSGTAWVLQGNLDGPDPHAVNLLQGHEPNRDAFVWTYSDPSVRGACIALPRGSGAVRSLASIMCQSATTGHACFWENMRATDPSPRTPGSLGWRNQTLMISQLADGTNLGETGNCPTCHRGNNVFIIAPDHPTWKKVLTGRGFVGGTHVNQGGTFTTQVESSSDMRGGHPRYIPITTLPTPRAGWENTFEAEGGCAGSCHENPADNVVGMMTAERGRRKRMDMAPECAGPAGASVENCYR